MNKMNNSEIKNLCKDISNNLNLCLYNKKISNKFCKRYYMDSIFFCQDNGIEFPQLKKIKNNNNYIDKYSYWLYY